MLQKKLKMKREAWIKNVMRIQGYSREEAEKLYAKIKPYKSDYEEI